jgi:tetratricopeptide (TPR) repeat protein
VLGSTRSAGQPGKGAFYAAGLYNEAVRMVKKAIERKRDCEGAYYLLFRGLFAAGRCQEVIDLSESAIEASGEDYNVYVPILNSLGFAGARGL